MAASHATLLARRAGAAFAASMLAAGLALAVAPAANANGYPRCVAGDFTGGVVSADGYGVLTISGDVSSAPGGIRCDGQIVIKSGATATLHLDDLTVYALNAPTAIDNQGTLTITGSGTLALTGTSSTGINNSGTLTISSGTLELTGTSNSAGIENSGTLTISGGAVTATGGDGDSQGGNGINNHGTMTVVGGSLTAAGGSGSSRGGDGIRNHNDATLVMTTDPTLSPGTGATGGSSLMNFSRIVMPAAPYVGFAAGDAQATIDANNGTVTPQVLYLFASAPAAGLRSPTHAFRTPLLRNPSTTTTVGEVVDDLGAVSAYWPKASSDVVFDGWFDAASGGAAYGSDDGRLLSGLGTPTFYGHWSAAQQPSQPSQSSSTQIATTTATTTSTPATTRTATATTATATTKTTPPTTSAFTPTNNVADPYTFTSKAAPSAPPLPTTSSASDGSHSELGLSDSSIQQSGDFTATASGFKPGTVADFYLWSTAVYLGSAIADVHGVAVLRIVLNPAYVGEHHVQVVGTGLQGQPRNLAQAITITQPPALAETGLNAGWLLGPAMILLLLGFGLLRVSRRLPARRH